MTTMGRANTRVLPEPVKAIPMHVPSRQHCRDPLHLQPGIEKGVEGLVRDKLKGRQNVPDVLHGFRGVLEAVECQGESRVLPSLAR